MQAKFVVILGTVMSGLGKGVVSSSILKFLDFYGYRVLPVKFDGYLNVDCGTMNPYRHGEVFVLEGGGEVDMDFGMYERFLNKDLSSDLSLTGGKLIGGVIEKERRGGYLGEDIQIVPHLTREIVERLEDIAAKNKLDVLVIEVGGTVGDIENSYFIEAMRELSLRRKVVFVDLTYIPELSAVGQQKTKPAQFGFRAIMSSGISPDFVVCRCEKRLDESTRKKLALFANLDINRIIDDSDVSTIYELPLKFMEQDFDKLLIRELGLEPRKIKEKSFLAWRSKVERIKNPKNAVNVGIVGKYVGLKDSYISLKEALVHSGAKLDLGVGIRWIESTDLEHGKAEARLKGLDGIIVPGGFGSRGVEGKIKAIEYARTNRIPYLGLCFGMQLMAIEYARNVCGIRGATSTEFDEKAIENVIDQMPSQKRVVLKGGTMRLGSWRCVLPYKNSIAFAAYGTKTVHERHRHRYELNNKYKKVLQDKRLRMTGLSPDKQLVEFIEWKDGFGIGTQAHPELKSRLEAPAPLFVEFLKAASAKSPSGVE